ncbi:MAG: phage portal protein [Pseudolysinimonas sp.]
MTTEIELTRDRLRRKLNFEVSRRLKVYDLYFEGEQPLKFIAPALQDELGDRLTAMVINLPRDGVSVYDDRLDVTGFRYPGAAEDDDQMWKVWLGNDGDLLSQQVHQESLALGRAYMIVGPGDDAELPLITAESPFDTIHEDDPRTHDVANGLHQWTELDGTRWVTVYQRGGRTTWWRPKRSGEWTVDSEVENTAESELCSLVPYLNYPRILGRLRNGLPDPRLGRSEFHDIIPIVDGINKMATDMMVSGEFHAMPRRWAFGLKAEDFEDEKGNEVSAWAMRASALWANENKDIKVGQFKESDLSNFRDTIKMLITIAGQMLGLPPGYNAFETVNPPSGDSIRSSEIKLLKRSERKQANWGNKHGRVQRLVQLELTGADDPKAREIETRWRSAATPTKAQEADATVKLVQAKDGQGRSIVTVTQARQDLGYSAEALKRMAADDAREDPIITDAKRELEVAGASGAAGSR